MKILGIKQYGIQKYQEGTNGNGIQLKHLGSQYQEISEIDAEDNYMQTPTGKVVNFQLPEIEVTAKSPTGDAWKDRNLYKAYKGRKYISEGRQEAKPLALGLAGLTAAPALTGVGISNSIQPLDVSSVVLDPTDWMNWVPFGLHVTPRVYNTTKQIIDPKKRAAHAYVNISPVGYDRMGQRAKSFMKDILKGEDADVNHPKWDLKKLGNSVQDYIPETVKNRGIIAAYTRDDAWRIYNGLEPKYGMYLKNPDGTYSYNMDRINELSENTFRPILDMSGVHPYDYVTSSGGGLTKFENKPLTSQNMKTYGVQTIEDIWDLHPFSRANNLISKRFPIIETPFIAYNKIRTNISNNLKNIGDDFKYDSKSIKSYLKQANEYEQEMFDPEMFPKYGTSYNIGTTINKIADFIKPSKQYWEYSPLKNLNNYGKNLEAGKILGGKPFMMRTEIPYTSEFKIDNTLKNIQGNTQYGFIPNNGILLPSEVQLYKRGIKDLNKIQNNYINNNLDLNNISLNLKNISKNTQPGN